MGTSVAIPAYLQIVHRDWTGWHFRQPRKIIYAPTRHDSDFFTCRETHYGLTKARIVLEFKLLTGGKLGWYLADMKNKTYYFCGADWEDVRAQVRALGIGRPPSPPDA